MVSPKRITAKPNQIGHPSRRLLVSGDGLKVKTHKETTYAYANRLSTAPSYRSATETMPLQNRSVKNTPESI